jgi:uncharacterized membrane protein YozB (DUF420 family)
MGHMTYESGEATRPLQQPTSAPRWPRTLFRSLTTCEALLALTQAALAGGFLDGNYGALDMHQVGAMITAAFAVLQLVSAVLLWRLGGGPGWPAAACGALIAAETGQIGLGYGRVLAVHVPLGAAIIACTFLMLAWSWRSAPEAAPARKGEPV